MGSVAISSPVTFSIDHAVLFVEDLERATVDFERVGFKVTPGGTHAGGLTKNAIIPLTDGTYLELLAFNIPDTLRELPHNDALMAISGTTAMDHRFLPRGAQGEGFRDLGLATVGLRNVVANARSAGLEIEGPFPGRRVRPDGKEVAWELAFPKDPGLPFLIEDVTERGLRVPSGDATKHPNGVTAISEVVMEVAQFERTVKAYGALLGSKAQVQGQTATFPLRDSKITISTERKPCLRLRTGASGVTKVPERILNIEY